MILVLQILRVWKVLPEAHLLFSAAQLGVEVLGNPSRLLLLCFFIKKIPTSIVLNWRSQGKVGVGRGWARKQFENLIKKDITHLVI